MIHQLSNNIPVLLAVLLVLDALQLATAQFGDFGDIGGFGNQKCKIYSCSKGYAPVPKKKMKFTSPGCDAMGGGAMMLNPGAEGEAEGKPYESCCHEWHACFQVCGTSKQACDDTYKKCVEEKCKPTKGKACSESANMSMMMMQLTGCKQFDVAQSQACDCVTKYGDKHLKDRELALTKFYKLYAPESVHKVPDLIIKANTSVKFANLLKKLIHKYPDSIELVEDPQTKMYRDMMGNATRSVKTEEEGEEEEEDLGDIEDFDVDEDLGTYKSKAEEDAAGVKQKNEETPEKKKKKKLSPPVPPLEEEDNEEEDHEDEFNQYQEL